MGQILIFFLITPLFFEWREYGENNFFIYSSLINEDVYVTDAGFSGDGIFIKVTNVSIGSLTLYDEDGNYLGRRTYSETGGWLGYSLHLSGFKVVPLFSLIYNERLLYGAGLNLHVPIHIFDISSYLFLLEDHVNFDLDLVMAWSSWRIGVELRDIIYQPLFAFKVGYSLDKLNIGLKVDSEGGKGILITVPGDVGVASSYTLYERFGGRFDVKILKRIDGKE